MSGSAAGWKKAEQTMIDNLGVEGYHESRRQMGRKGGLLSRGGGFKHWKNIGREDLISAAGRLGGSRSRRGNAKHAKTT